jgi:hypothetical protein
MSRPIRRSTTTRVLISSSALWALCSGSSVGCDRVVDATNAESDPRGVANVARVGQAITADDRWTTWISEEFGPAECPDGMAVIAAECSGSYCDQIRLRCDTLADPIGEAHWTYWVEAGGDFFGNGNKSDATCEPNEWMTGIDCNGDFCDNVRIECSPTNRTEANCDWTDDWYSEEQGVYSAPPDFYLRGVRCQGAHCDNKQYLICQTRPLSDASCNEHCGSASANGTCWCDELCVQYGDCCSDHADFCG